MSRRPSTRGAQAGKTGRELGPATAEDQEEESALIRERFSLAGKTALVTGASRGIGRAIALGFAEHGADLVLSSRKREALESVAKEVEALGRRAHVATVNMSNEESIAALVSELERAALVIDVLVNNAATNPVMAGVLDLGVGAWRKVFETNVTGLFLLSQAIARGMVSRGAGSIVNIASNGGIHATPALAAYGASKAAVIHLTKTMAMELGPRGVRVNAIAPGLIETHMARALLDNPAGYEAYVKRNPLRRHGQPEEIAGAALLLASDAGSYANGEVLVVDGGATL
ncbi:MAG TPA: SDR family NAD(P)-dependent oxidoreductase [Myxococcota bacterium]|nr:SDR family NAD(P)-dependent oxidoreductase [Myxococcota bacterium]